MKRTWIFYALILTIVIFCYFNSVKNEFVWDDHTIIVRNETIKDISNVKAILLSEDTTEDMEHTGFYRPLVYFSYAVDYYLWGDNASGFRLINIFFHFLSALIVFLLGRELFNNPKIAFAAAAIFAAHPIHVESVSFISARGSEMCGFYYLLALLFFIKARRSGKLCYMLISSVSFFIAFLAKEFTITLFIIMLGYDIAYKRELKEKPGYKAAALTYIPYAFFTGLYLFARSIATSGTGSVGSLAGSIFDSGILLRVIDSARIMLRYFWLMLSPNGLTVDYHFEKTVSLLSINTLIAVLFFVAALYLLNHARKFNRALFLSGLIFLSPLLLVCGILPIKGDAALADRWAYISTAGFALIVAYSFSALVERLSRRRRGVLLREVVTGLLFFLIGFYSLMTIARNGVFRDELSLWRDTTKKNPASYKAHINYGFALYKSGLTYSAYDEYIRALVIKPDSVKAQYNIAVFHHNKMEFNRAIEKYEAIVDQGYIFPDLLINLAECYYGAGNSVEALIYYKQALKLAPDSKEALKKVARIYGKMGNNDMSREYNALYENLKKSEDVDEKY